jgi:hypothetical protein
MARSDVEGKLTPAARQALDELLDDYRKRVLLGASDSASTLGDVHEISVHDIMAGLERLQADYKGRLPSLLLRILSAYIVLGIVAGLSGLVTFSYRQILQGRSVHEQLPLLFALSGFSLSAVSYAYLRLRSARGSYHQLGASMSVSPLPGYVGAFIAQWRDLELGLREAAAARLGESGAAAPMSALVDRLINDGQLSPEDGQRMRELVRLRNQIIHQGRDISENVLLIATRDAERITTRLRLLSSAAS